MASRHDTCMSYAADRQALPFSATSAQSVVLSTGEHAGAFVQICPTQTCFITAGPDPVATTNSMRIPANMIYTLQISDGHKIAAIQESAAGILSITVMK